MALINPTRFLAVTALAALTLGAASAAQARSDVYFSIGLQGSPGYYAQPEPVYIQPQPVYVQPRPVYVPPRPVYVQPPAYYGPNEVYLRRGPPAYEYRYDRDRHDRREEWRHRQWKWHHQDRD